MATDSANRPKMTLEQARAYAEGADPRIVDPKLIEKYSTSGPRYTSYPTAPHFYDIKPSEITPIWRASNDLAEPPELTLYLHIPFCKTLCHFCGCNTNIRKSETDANPYVDTLIGELGFAAGFFDDTRRVRCISFGGGTPNFISIDSLDRIFSAITEFYGIADSAEISVEIDPRTVTQEKVKSYLDHGFNRFSMGVQDFNEDVIKAVGRRQGELQVETTVEMLRQADVKEINFDLIYGLPGQDMKAIKHSVAKTIELRPTRIAYYNYAHVPWMKKHQAHLAKLGLPDSEAKTEMYGYVFEQLLDAGYVQIGMDHFALPEDPLTLAYLERRLNRNFMGYTNWRGNDLIGFGASAISAVAGSYSQNDKELAGYSDLVAREGAPIVKGYVLSDDDVLRRELIIDLFCNFGLLIGPFSKRFEINFGEYFAEEIKNLKIFIDDGLLEISDEAITVTAGGRFFVRNICMTFDKYIESSPEQRRYSKTI